MEVRSASKPSLRKLSSSAVPEPPVTSAPQLFTHGGPVRPGQPLRVRWREGKRALQVRQLRGAPPQQAGDDQRQDQQAGADDQQPCPHLISSSVVLG